MEQPKRIAFGDWTPDLEGLANRGLALALNTLPIAAGYEGFNALKAITGFAVLPAAPTGAIAVIDRKGNPANFAGTATDLYRLKADPWEEVSAVTGAYNCKGESRWAFEVFGQNVVACNPQDVPQVFTLPASTKFAKLGNDTTQAPRAAHVGVIGTFLVLGNTNDLINGPDETAIHWSALNDIFHWPTPDTESATAVQSGRQPLAGDGGAVQRVVSGAEVAAIFQERSIWRADYRGGDVVFELNRVEPDRGLLIPQIALPFGREVFYLNEDGFYTFDYTSSTPLGQQRVNSYFLNDAKEDYYYRISAAPDPKTARLWITYPGAGSELQTDPGAPNKLLMYDWYLDRFTHGDEAIELLSEVVAAGLHLDSPHTAADPDTDGVDGAGLPSFDARIAGAGARSLGGYSPTFQISDMTGQPKAARLETGLQELTPSRRSLATRCRPLVDSVDPTISVAELSKTNEDTVFSAPVDLEDDGEAPLMHDARYHAFRVDLPSGFENAIGLDVESQPSGRW